MGSGANRAFLVFLVALAFIVGTAVSTTDVAEAVSGWKGAFDELLNRILGIESRVDTIEQQILIINNKPFLILDDDFFITALGIPVTINGQSSDDGLPNNELTLEWQKIDGPGEVEFLDNSIFETNVNVQIDTDITFSEIGLYDLRLTVSDGVSESFDDIQVEVLEELPEPPEPPEPSTLSVSVTGIDFIPGVGTIVNIFVSGAAQSVVIDILSQTQELIGRIEFVATDEGLVSVPWPVPNDTPPGLYTIRVTDAFNSAETSFILE